MREKLLLLIAVPICASLVLAGCRAVPAAIEKTVYVGPYLVDCEGAGPQKCLLVKENPEDEYSLFYDQIEGFDYEEGYEYELRVSEETLQDPPADASAIRWTLIEVVSKTTVGAPLEGTPWRLDSYVNTQGESVGVMPDTEITAQFEAGEISGSAGCNRYFGSYDVDGDKLTIGPLASTEMYCYPDEVMDQEMAYLAALGDAASFNVEGDRLDLADSAGQTILVFAVRQPAPLTGTMWQMTSYNNGREAVVSPLRGTEITALFGEDGSLTGSAGCNNYATTYDLDGDNITMGAIGITFMMCAEPEGIMEQESAYLAALESARSYSIEGDTLALRDAEGRRAVSYVAAPEQGPGLTEDTLKNAEYGGIYEEAVQLIDGRYEGEPFVEGGASRPTVTFIDPYAFGDLDGDGVEDAAVLLAENSGGSGTFIYLAAVLNRNGNPQNTATQLLGDRVQVNSLSIEDGEIIVDVITHGPDDPMCCPTQQVVQTYELRDNELVQTSEEVISAAAESEIVGVVWKWVKFLGSDDTTIVVDDPDKYTLELLPDGQVRIQADCNSASGTYTLDGAGGLTLELGPTTLAECEPGPLYDEYLEMLGWVRTYVLEGGQLFLNLMADGGDMVFDRTGPTAAAGPDVVGVVWRWVKFLGGDGETIIVDDPDKYTLELLPDGQVHIRADCNSASGTYTLDGAGGLTLELGPTTLAECEPGSLYDEYLDLLGWVRTYVLAGDQLVLNMMADGGDLFFEKASPA
jgi:heat shock protein HslJ